VGGILEEQRVLDVGLREHPPSTSHSMVPRQGSCSLGAWNALSADALHPAWPSFQPAPQDSLSRHRPHAFLWSTFFRQNPLNRFHRQIIPLGRRRELAISPKAVGQAGEDMYPSRNTAKSVLAIDSACPKLRPPHVRTVLPELL
jgi:hypothetical protein